MDSYLFSAFNQYFLNNLAATNMDLKNFLDFFRAYKPIEQTAKALADKDARINWKGLVG